jgi:hypothetical protein
LAGLFKRSHDPPTRVHLLERPARRVDLVVVHAGRWECMDLVEELIPTNLYTYSLNSPISFVDLDGRSAMAAPGGESDPCGNRIIPQLREALDMLSGRAGELLRDPQNLQAGHWSKANPHPDFGSVEGHQEQFRGWQNRARTLMDEFNKNKCGHPASVRANAYKLATMRAPNPRLKVNRDAAVKAAGATAAVVGAIEAWTVAVAALALAL